MNWRNGGWKRWVYIRRDVSDNFIIACNQKLYEQWEEMTDGRLDADFQKIKEAIHELQSLKEQCPLPVRQADASIAALQNQLSTNAE